MTKSCNRALSQESLATYGTLLTVGQAFLGAGCCLAGNDLGSMAKSLSLICYVRVAAYGAGVGGVAILGASGFGYCCIISMAKSVNLVCYVGVATYGTGVGGVACLGAGGLGYCCNVVVTKSVNLVCYVSVATYGTSVGGVACLSAGGLGYCCIISMLKSLSLICYVGVATYGTGVGGVACLGAGGLGYCCNVVVTKSLSLICYVGVATVGAGVSGVACLGAGGLGYFCNVVMAKLSASGNYSASCAAAFTSTTSSLCAVLGASCIVVVTVSAIVVAELLNKNFLAYGTNLIVSAISFRAGNVCAVFAFNLANIATVFTLFGDHYQSLAVALGAADFYVVMAGDLADLATTVTLSVTSIVIDVAAGDGKCVEDLLSNVIIATIKGIGDVYEEYVTHHYSVSKGMDRSKICCSIKNVVYSQVYSNTANGELGVERCVDQINKLVAGSIYGVDKASYGDGDYVNLFTGDTGDLSLNVGVVHEHKIGYERLSLCGLSGKLKAEDEVGCGVVKIGDNSRDIRILNEAYVKCGKVDLYVKLKTIYVAKSHVEELVVLLACKSVCLTYGNLDLVNVEGSKVSDELIKLCGSLVLGKVDHFKDLSESEGVLLDCDLEINVELLGKRITVVVTKNNNGCICGNCCDGLRVEDVVGDVLVESSLCNSYCEISNGDLNGKFAVLAKGFSELVFGKLEPTFACFISKVINDLIEVNGVTGDLGNACIDKRSLKSCAELVNVGKVLLTDEGCPVALSNFLALEVLKVCTYVLHSKSVNVYVCSNHLGKACLKLSVEFLNEVKNVVNVCGSLCECLIHCVANNEGIVVAYNNKVVCIEVNGACSNLCPSSSLSLGEPSYVSKSFCKSSELVGDHKDLGVVGNNVLACEDVIYMVTGCVNNIGNGSVYVKNDAVNVCDVLTDLCKDLSNGSISIYNEAKGLSDLTYNKLMSLCESSLNVAVDLYKVTVEYEDLFDRVVINLIKNGLYALLNLRNNGSLDVLVQGKEYELVSVVACLNSKDLKVSKVSVKVVLKREYGIDETVHGRERACCKSSVDLSKSYNGCIKFSLDKCLELIGSADFVKIKTVDEVDCLVDGIYCICNVAVFKRVVVAILVCVVVVLSDELLYVVETCNRSILEICNYALFFKSLVDYNNDANLILNGVTFLVEDHVDYGESKLLLVDLAIAIHKKGKDLSAESRVLHVSVIGPKALCSEVSNHLLSDLEVLGDVSHGNAGIGIFTAANAGDLGNELGAGFLKLINRLGYLLKNAELLIKRKLLNNLGHCSSNVCNCLVCRLFFNYKCLNGSINDAEDLLVGKESAALSGIVGKSLVKLFYNLKLGNILNDLGVSNLKLTVNGKKDVKLCSSIKTGHVRKLCNVQGGDHVLKENKVCKANDIKNVAVLDTIVNGPVDVVYDCKCLFVVDVLIVVQVCNNVFKRLNVLVCTEAVSIVKDLIYAADDCNSVIVGKHPVAEYRLINNVHDKSGVLVGEFLILNKGISLIKNYKDLISGKVTVCTKEDVDVLNNGSVGICAKDFVKLLACGVLLGISTDYSLSKGVMAFLRGMRANTVTDYATRKECQQTLQLAISNSVRKRVGRVHKSKQSCIRRQFRIFLNNRLHLFSDCGLKLGHNRTKGIVAQNSPHAENGCKRYGAVLACDYSLLKRQVHSNCLSRVRVVGSIHRQLLKSLTSLLVFLNIFQRDKYRRIFSLAQHIPDHAEFNVTLTILFTNNGLYETIANDSVRQRDIIGVNPALNRLIRFSPVELSIGVCAIANVLHKSGQSCDELINGLNNKTQQIADGQFTLNGSVIITEGVHDGNQNDLHVRILLQNRIQSACVVQCQRNSNVHNCIFKSGSRNLFSQNRLQIRSKSHNEILPLRLALAQKIFIIIVFVSIGVLETNSLKNEAKAKYTQITVTNGKRDHVSSSNARLIVLGDNCNLFTLTQLTIHRNIVVKAGVYDAVIFATRIALPNGTHDMCIGSLGTRMVANFVKSPVVTAGEILIPLCLIPLLNFGLVLGIFVVLFVILSNKLVNDLDQFKICVIKFQQPVDVLGTNTGHCKLSVAATRATLCQLIKELVGISCITVVRNAGVMVIAFKTIAIGHRVAKGNIVDMFFGVIMIIRLNGQCEGANDQS